MDAEIKRKWVKALRSGEYRQAQEYLKEGQSYCCLGVLCVIQGCDVDNRFPTAIERHTAELPSDLRAGLSDDDAGELAEMNDDGQPFSEIADYIEQNL